MTADEAQEITRGEVEERGITSGGYNAAVEQVAPNTIADCLIVARAREELARLEHEISTLEYPSMSSSARHRERCIIRRIVNKEGSA